MERNVDRIIAPGEEPKLLARAQSRVPRSLRRLAVPSVLRHPKRVHAAARDAVSRPLSSLVDGNQVADEGALLRSKRALEFASMEGG